jgi:hypothetical protein
MDINNIITGSLVRLNNGMEWNGMADGMEWNDGQLKT